MRTTTQLSLFALATQAGVSSARVGSNEFGRMLEAEEILAREDEIFWSRALQTETSMSMSMSMMMSMSMSMSMGMYMGMDMEMDDGEMSETVEAEVKSASLPTVYDTLTTDGSYNTFVSALSAADVSFSSSPDQNYTVFAPIDDAFGVLPADIVACLMSPENKETLAVILKYHIVPGNTYSVELDDGVSATTVGGESLVFHTDDGFMVNGARVVSYDTPATDGVVYGIDSGMFCLCLRFEHSMLFPCSNYFYSQNTPFFCTLHSSLP